MSQQRTHISQVGEFGLIQRIQEAVQFRVDDAGIHNHLIKGISDDAAVYRPTSGKVQLLTTDALVEGIHFDLTFTSFQHLGWKAIVASLSDVAAMGGIPRYAVITLCLPGKVSVEMVEDFYSGASYACKKYSCLIVGGDTTTTYGNLVISVAMTGEAEESHLVYRSGAKPGDYLCVTGRLGGSLAGLKILQQEKAKFLNAGNKENFTPELQPYSTAIEKHLLPKPRFDLINVLRENMRLHAMIDISDGLASEIHHICNISGVGATVYEHNLPIDPNTRLIARHLSESPVDYALYGGEEYELLFTVADEGDEKLGRLTNDVSIIGRITEPAAGIELIRENGEHERLTAKGWDHFKNTV